MSDMIFLVRLNTLHWGVRNSKGLRGNCSQSSAAASKLQIWNSSTEWSSSQIWICLKNEENNVGRWGGWVGEHAEPRLHAFTMTLSLQTVNQLDNTENGESAASARTWWRNFMQRLTLPYPGASLQGSCCHGHCEWKSVKRSGVALQCLHTEHFFLFSFLFGLFKYIPHVIYVVYVLFYLNRINRIKYLCIIFNMKYIKHKVLYLT